MGASVAKINYDDIEYHEEIGHGQFGPVNRVTLRTNLTGCTQALAKSVFNLHKDEITTLSKLKHRNLVKVLGLCHNEPLDVILLEFPSNVSVLEYLSDESKPLSSGLMKRWAIESALAIRYLHRHNILHRGIEPRNCLLFKDNLLKLSEIGLVRNMDNSTVVSNQKITFRYVAPEIHKENDKGRDVYSKQAEIYAYGMLLLQICTRKQPFDGMSCAQVVFGVENGILQPTIPTNCPQRLSMVMRCCWKYDPNERPSIGYIMSALSEYTLTKKIIPLHHMKILRVFQVACSPNGDMVIASGIKKLHILNKDGSYKKRMKTTEDECEKKIGMVLSIAISSSEHIFVLDSRKYIKVFDVDGGYFHCFSTLGAGSHPDASVNLGWIAIDGEGHLVVDDCGRKVKTIHSSPDGQLIKTVKQANYGSMFVCNKKYMLYHFRPSGSLYTKVVSVDHFNNEVFALTPRIDEEMVPGEKMKARGITCDREDNIYVAVSLTNESVITYNTGHVHKYSPSGTFMACVANNLFNPCDVSIAYDGSVVIANQESLLVYEMNSFDEGC